jgi:hypothetical protein
MRLFGPRQTQGVVPRAQSGPRPRCGCRRRRAFLEQRSLGSLLRGARRLHLVLERLHASLKL